MMFLLVAKLPRESCSYCGTAIQRKGTCRDCERRRAELMAAALRPRRFGRPRKAVS